MQRLGGYKKAMQMSLFSFFALFLVLSPALAQEVPEMTGTSTDNLMGPGVNIDTTPEPTTNESPIISNTVERSRYGSYERALVKAVDQISSQTSNGAKLKNNYTVQILTGDFKNKTYTVRNSGSDTITPKTGDLIMVFIQPGGAEEPQIFFETYDRKNIYIFSGIALTLLLLAFFGLRGLLIGATAFLILWLGAYTTIPLYLRDWPLILTTGLAALLLSSISSLLLFGWHRKTLATIIASVISTTITTIVAQIFASSMHLTVINDPVVASFFADHPTIDASNLVILGLILASFAIIQDIASSISCGIAELKKINPNSKWKALFTNGMNIGRAHAGTMILVLILAWVGASMSIFLYRYQLNTTWLHFLNQDAVSSVFLLSIAGTIGLLLSIPIASVVSATAWTKIPKPEEPTHQSPSWKDQLPN